MNPLSNRNVARIEPLPSPREIAALVPCDRLAEATILSARAAICDLLHGSDRVRLLAIVGPCPIHDPASALDYAARLSRLAGEVSDRLLIVMRTYFEKPRTILGWKGLLNDPHLDDSCDIRTGLEVGRRVLLEVNRMGLPCATELLDPITPQYLGDLVSWAVIGARTTSSQVHREMASGLSMPVGFKNATDGSVEVAVHAMTSAAESHAFVGIDPEGRTATVRTRGNPDRQLVLRGGREGPNYADTDIEDALARLADQGIARPLIIDCSHDNSGKNHTQQAGVLRETVRRLAAGRAELGGILVESHLRPGMQKWTPGAKLEYGVSITDACIGWEETESLLREAADLLRAAPNRTHSA